jgi:quinol-cytochrome oxidoreductase complex cytochrome b subunit
MHPTKVGCCLKKEIIAIIVTLLSVSLSSVMVSLIVVAIVVILIFIIIIVEITHPPSARNASDQGWLLPKKTRSLPSSLHHCLICCHAQWCLIVVAIVVILIIIIIIVEFTHPSLCQECI